MKRFVFFIAFCTFIFSFKAYSTTQNEPQAKYIFYFIGDGMGVNQVIGTEMYLAEIEDRIGVVPLSFTQFPICNFATTYSGDHSITCSAAAGTALACGVKTKNGQLGVDVNGKPVESIASRFKSAGKKVGIITSVGANHATPAAFYAHQKSRSMYNEISRNMVASGFDLYAGGGLLKSKNTTDSTVQSIYKFLTDNSYNIVRDLPNFKSDETGKFILLPEHEAENKSLAYAIDRKEGDITLSQFTEVAINFLSNNSPQGFFLMAEGGKIDWSCHDNDPATTFLEVIDFSEAVQKAIDFYNAHPDETLIVVTADHETGGISLGINDYNLHLQVLRHQKKSAEEITFEIKRLRKVRNNNVSWEEVKEVLNRNLGFWGDIKLSELQTNSLKDIYEKTFKGDKVEMDKSLYSENEPIVTASIKLISRMAHIGWSTGKHSAGAVPVYVIGVGSQLFNGSLDNTDIPKRILKAAGKKW
ncbi:MAG: alkaline phosphatase [Culturomica sp.]|jgi:alkaline phosphatase|nr:alkaline phosphatase [Culturomica sp.]